MRDVSEQLREWSDALAQAVEPTTVDEITSPMVPSGRLDNRRWIAVAASIFVIGAGVVAVATLDNDGSGQIGPATNPPQTEIDSTTAPTQPSSTQTSAPAVVPVPTPTTQSTTTSSPSTTTAPTTSADPPDRLEGWPSAPAAPTPVEDIPAFLPAAPIAPAGTPVRAQADGGSTAPPTFTQVFADANQDILLTIQTQPNGIESTPEELRQPITIDGWDDAFTSTGGLRLVASDPGGFVRLTGTGLDMEQAAAIVTSMQRRPDGVPGWDLAPGINLVEINGAWNDSAGQRFVTWFEGDRVVAQMLASPAHTDLIDQALTPAFERVDVNGMDGWLSTSGSRRSIVWSPDGSIVVVLGVADDRIDPLAIAESVMEFDPVVYESMTTTEVPAGVGDGCDGNLFC